MQKGHWKPYCRYGDLPRQSVRWHSPICFLPPDTEHAQMCRPPGKTWIFLPRSRASALPDFPVSNSGISSLWFPAQAPPRLQTG